MNEKILLKDLRNKKDNNELIEKILNWNNNNNLILWTFNKDKFAEDIRLLENFSNKDYIPFKTMVFKDNNENRLFYFKHTDYNIFISTLFVDKINEDSYLLVKEDNMKNIYKDIDKNVLMFEIHINYKNYADIIELLSVRHNFDTWIKNYYKYLYKSL